MIHDAPRLADIFGRPALAKLVDRLRSRVRLGRQLGAVITLNGLKGEERFAIDGLLNRPASRGTTVSVRPDELEQILRDARICDSLEEALAHLFPDLLATRQAGLAAERAWREQMEHGREAFGDLPQCAPWLDGLLAGGRIKRWFPGDPPEAGRSLQIVAGLLRGRPYPVVPLAELAARLTGDSHALDRGTALSQLCLSALRSLQPDTEQGLSRRQLWDAAGVVIDELSAPVLVLNVRARPDTLLGRLLNPLADAGEPCHLSVRLLRKAAANDFVDPSFWICENPSVVAAAAQRLGARSRPLICTAGQPASTAQLLLMTLRTAGKRLAYHGDFDPAGITIANLLLHRFGVEPWRMSAADYDLAQAKGPSLSGRCPPAAWDPGLAPAMNARAHAILEESVLEVLLADLTDP